MGAEISLMGSFGVMAVHALNYWVFKSINVP